MSAKLVKFPKPAPTGVTVIGASLQGYSGYYRLGTKMFIGIQNEPKWLHKLTMKWIFGWVWVNEVS